MTPCVENIMNQLRQNRMTRKIAPQKPQPTLIEEIRTWWDDQTEINRFPCYSMQFLVNTFGYAPSRIGPALCELGWTRRRSWRKNKPFCRVWVPPTRNNENER